VSMRVIMVNWSAGSLWSLGNTACHVTDHALVMSLLLGQSNGWGDNDRESDT